jgi:hypothetical protein
LILDGIPVADYAEIGNQMQLCNFQFPSGRIAGELAYEYRPDAAGEETGLAWVPKTTDFPHGIYLSGIKLYSIPLADIDLVCPLVRKGVAHLAAGELVIREVERLTGKTYNQVVWPNGVEAGTDEQLISAMRVMTDYLAIWFISPQDQLALVGRSQATPTVITKSHIRDAESMMGMIVQDDMSWWHQPQIWNQLPD